MAEFKSHHCGLRTINVKNDQTCTRFNLTASMDSLRDLARLRSRYYLTLVRQIIISNALILYHRDVKVRVSFIVIAHNSVSIKKYFYCRSLYLRTPN